MVISFVLIINDYALMGNTNRKNHNLIRNESQDVNKPGNTYLSQFSLSNFTNNLSGRSFGSIASHQSTYSVSRPWSRVSRRRWHHSTLNDPFEASKTAWPVPYIESLFLPEFKINGDITEKDFEVTNTISRGAFGKVYKVIKKDTRDEYALKILSKSQIISEKAVNQVKDEVRIQSMCGHNPFIVNCPFYWQSRKRLFIVIEYVCGGELLKLCQDYGPLPQDLAQIYVAELALALDFLHNAGIVFRDLKLENVLLDEQCHLQLIDFGLAKWLKYGSRTTTLCGTLQYMAPEVVNMEPYGHAVDWWSLGVVACCMLSGQTPGAPVQHHEDWPEGTPGSLPENFVFSAPASDVLTRLLERDPQRRLKSLLALQGTAFFKHFNFADVRAKKFSPRWILESHFPNGPLYLDIITEDTEDFKSFDSELINS